MKDLDKIGIFLAGLGIFSRAILEWLQFFGVNPRRARNRDWDSDFDWEKELLS